MRPGAAVPSANTRPARAHVSRLVVFLCKPWCSTRNAGCPGRSARHVMFPFAAIGVVQSSRI